MNFYKIIEPHVDALNKTEYKLLNFVIQHMSEINNKSIREVSSLCYVSTTTFLRFVRKIGFSGYSEFTTVLKFTEIEEKSDGAKQVIVQRQEQYRTEYLKNIEETVRVLDAQKFRQISHLLIKKPKLFFFAKGFSKFAAKYINYLYTINGFLVVFPENYEERLLAYQMIEKDDLIFVFDYSGEDTELIENLYTIKRECQYAAIISITSADKNAIQNMSDHNLYYFSDELRMNNVNMGSQVSLIIIMELLLYQFLEENHSPQMTVENK